MFADTCGHVCSYQWGSVAEVGGGSPSLTVAFCSVLLQPDQLAPCEREALTAFSLRSANGCENWSVGSSLPDNPSEMQAHPAFLLTS